MLFLPKLFAPKFPGFLLMLPHSRSVFGLDPLLPKTPTGASLFQLSLKKFHAFILCFMSGISEAQPIGIDDIQIKGDEFWDYNKQVDLEAFSSKEFYSTLTKQSSDVTSALARQKDQVCFCLDSYISFPSPPPRYLAA